MAGLHFDITGDNSNFMRKLDEARNGVRSTSKQIEESGVSIEQMFGRLAKGAAAFGAGFTAKELISNVVRVRGEFQQLEVAFNTMLGSEDKATTLMSQLVKTAATTPFDLQSVANGAKQLLAYGTSAEAVNGTLVQLGDIAAGLSIPLNDLVWLYGTTMTQGRLFTQDFRQFQGRGIPLADELAKQFGVTKDKVSELVTAGKVGFPEVQKAIESMTSEGGKFGGLMAAQSRTITGQISNIEDSFSTMYNNIGKQSEGFINDALSGVSYLIANYEDIGKIILELVGTYGAYRTALMVTTALQTLQASGITALTVKEAVHYGWLVLTKKAQDALNLSMLKNPYVLAAAAVAGLGYGIYKLITYQTDAEKAQAKLNDAVKEYEKSSLSEQRELAKLKGELSGLTKGTDEYNTVKDKIVKGFGKYYSGLDTEIEKVGLTETAYNKLTEAINKSFGARQYEKFASEQQEELSNTMAENLGNIQDKLLEELGNETGSKIYAKIRNSMMQGSLSLGVKPFEIQGLDAETKAALNKVAGEEGGLFDITSRSIEGYIQNIILANKATDKLDKKARERFGIDDNSGKKNEDVITQNEEEKKAVSEWLSSYKKSYEDADKAYNDFLKSKQVMSDADRDKELKRLKELRDTAKTTYQSKGGSTSSDNKQENQADKLREQQEKLNLLLNKQALEQSRSEQDLQNQVDQARIDARKDGSTKTIAQMQLNHKKEMQQFEREKEDKLRKAIEDARAIFDAEEDAKKAKNPKHVKETFDASGIKLSDSDTKQYDTQKGFIGEKQKRETEEYYKSLRDSYQDYTDQHIAIEEKFNADIATLQEARKKYEQEGNTEKVQQTDRAIAQATKDKGQGLMQLDYDKLKESPEYVRAFENLKQTSSETLNSLLSQLENAKHTAAEVLSPDQLREYTTTIQSIMDELDSRNPFQALADRKKELAEAEEELAEAKRNLDTVNSGGKVASGTKLNEKTGKIDTTYLSSTQALEKYNKAKDKSVKADAKVKKAEKEVTDVVGELSKSIKEVGDAIGGSAGEIISLIGDIGLFAMTAMSGVYTASTTASKSIQAVEKASVILAIIGAAIQIAMKIASLFKDDDGVAAYEKAKDVYESYIDILDRVIEKQKELFELNSKTGEQAYEKAKETVKKQENASRELGKQYLNSGASKGFLGIGSSASEGVKQRDDMSSNALDEAKKVLGRDYNKATDGRMTGLFDMSAKQLADLQRDAPLFWAELHDDTQKYLQQIIDCNEEITKLEQDRMEGLVKTDFSSFSDSFLDMLTDLDSSSQDFADNFEKYLQNAILTSLITDKYKSNIEALYKQWADDTESGNKLTEDEAIALRKKQEELANSMLEERNQLMKDFGWTSGESSSQDSTKGGFETMSQDTGEELNGRFTALQISNEEIKNSMTLICSNLSSLCTTAQDGNIFLMEMRNLAIMSNSYLEDIAGFQKKIVNDFGRRLESIDSGIQKFNSK